MGKLNPLSRMDIAADIIPINLATGTNTGAWVSLRNYAWCQVLLFKGAGANGEPPAFTFNQATTVAGGSTKAASIITTIWTKQHATTLTTTLTTWTKATQAAASTYTMAAGDTAAILVIEVDPAKLDIANGFCFLQATIADVGATSQIGGVLYLLYDGRYSESPDNKISPFA